MKIKTIDITAKEWFDKVNGNSYFSAEVTLNFGMKNVKTIILPFQYGYGESYLDMARSELIELGYIKKNGTFYFPLTRHCRRNNIILRTNKIENCLKRDLHK